jgi:peptidyl-prolyl cis-trans isomerase B (cyclophilin B)
MKQHLAFSILLCFLIFNWSCQEEKKKTPQRKKAEKKHKKADKIPKLKMLNARNVKGELYKFAQENPETRVLIETSLGDIEVKLYEDTPLHRANFLRLIKSTYYDHTVFHRVIKDFMIQGGGTDDKNPIKAGYYRIPNEVKAKHIHRKGALAMAVRDKDNPNRDSSFRDFYIVEGVLFDNPHLDALAQEEGFKVNLYTREVYTSVGGSPHLDGLYTVFGEVVKGMNVVEKIAKVKTDEGYWPLEDITIKMKVLD